MGSPFPGMDPWLEHSGLWPGFHDSLVTYLRDALQGVLPPAYYADLQHRIFLEKAEKWIVPDVDVACRRQSPARPRDGSGAGTGVGAILLQEPTVEIREPFVEIRDARSGDRIVTVIEVLSPSNKRPVTEGGRIYREKQQEILRSGASLVEIDLLRGGEHVVAVSPELLEAYRPFHYLVVVRRASQPSHREAYPIPLSSPLPRVAVPLEEPDPDVEADLQGLVRLGYDRGAYGRRLDYSRPPDPPLSAQDAEWADDVLRRAGRR